MRREKKQHEKNCVGGFAFVGGAVMYLIGTLGFAHVDVQANYMKMLQYLGVIAMITSIVLGICGLTNDK